MISRDLMTAVGFLVARVIPWLRPVQFKARFSGKLVTVLQLVTFVALLRFPQWVTPLSLAGRPLPRRIRSSTTPTRSGARRAR